tara:strand:- start:10278 stop:11081 length:804 start_codon:yes stop_codon:yes gene_type:complete
MKNFYLKVFILFFTTLTLSGCGTSLKEFVSSSSSGDTFTAGPPDEFLTVTKKPLILPPDYILRPPSDALDMEINDPMKDAREIVLSENEQGPLTEGEKYILEMVNADEANPDIKKELFLEEGAIKDETLSDYFSRLKEERTQILKPEDELNRLNSESEISDSPKNDDLVQQESFRTSVEPLNLNKFMLQKLEGDVLEDKEDKSINYDMSINDILGIDKPKSLEDKSVLSSDDGDNLTDVESELPPVDKMPTVFKGLMGGIMGGFGLF